MINNVMIFVRICMTCGEGVRGSGPLCESWHNDHMMITNHELVRDYAYEQDIGEWAESWRLMYDIADGEDEIDTERDSANGYGNTAEGTPC